MRVLAKEADEEEEEKQLTQSFPWRGGSQPSSNPLTSGVVTRSAASRARTSSGSAAVVSAVPVAKQVTVCVAEARRHPCLLSNLGSVVTQTKLDEFHHRFKVPRSILMRVP